MTHNPGLTAFTPFIGTWATVGHHPMVPGVTFHGRSNFDWHEGGAFVVLRTEIVLPAIHSYDWHGSTMHGVGEMSKDGGPLGPDLELSCTRTPTSDIP